jgi:hypothetical protein
MNTSTKQKNNKDNSHIYKKNNNKTKTTFHY